MNRKTWTRHSHYLPTFINSDLRANFPYPSCMSYFSSNAHKKKLSQQLIFFTQVWANAWVAGKKKSAESIILSFLNNLGGQKPKRYTNEIIHESLKTTCLEWLRRRRGNGRKSFHALVFDFFFYLENFRISLWIRNDQIYFFPLMRIEIQFQLHE